MINEHKYSPDKVPAPRQKPKSVNSKMKSAIQQARDLLGNLKKTGASILAEALDGDPEASTEIRWRLNTAITKLSRTRNEFEAELKSQNLPADAELEGITLKELDDQIEACRSRLNELRLRSLNKNEDQALQEEELAEASHESSESTLKKASSYFSKANEALKQIKDED